MEQDRQPINSYPAASPGLDVNTLLMQFGQAMARVGQLEQLCRIQEQRIAELEAAGTAHSSDPPGQLGPDIEARLRQKDETIESLRVQLMTCQSELTRTKEKLKLADEGAYMRHHRHHRRWWQFWK